LEVRLGPAQFEHAPGHRSTGNYKWIGQYEPLSGIFRKRQK
jgi:hypothetical protein